MLRNTLSLLLGVALLLAWALPAHADAPQTMHFQGYLKDAAGDPVDGSVDMVFALYDVASGGTALWSETHTDVPVDDGVYSVVLGSATPIDLAFDAPYYIGIAVGTDAEMTPRQELASSAYVMNKNEIQYDICRLYNETRATVYRPSFCRCLRVFVTSETYDGNLGGIAGADSKCQALADAAGLDGIWSCPYNAVKSG